MVGVPAGWFELGVMVAVSCAIEVIGHRADLLAGIAGAECNRIPDHGIAVGIADGGGGGGGGRAVGDDARRRDLHVDRLRDAGCLCEGGIAGNARADRAVGRS